jgi:hypothetical protein
MRISRISLAGALVGATLSLVSTVSATAAVDQIGAATGTQAAARVNDDSCGDDSVCFYRYENFHDKVLELEFPDIRRCYNLDHEITSVINNLRGSVEVWARPFCHGDDHLKIPAGTHEENVPPRRSFMLR